MKVSYKYLIILHAIIFNFFSVNAEEVYFDLSD